MMHSTTHLRRLAPLAALALLLPAAALSQQPAADTSLLTHIAVQARQRATVVAAGAAAPNAASVTLYRDALADIQRHDLTTAATELSAALARTRDYALYRGELGYVTALLGRLDEAASEYTRAYQAQQRNAWYLAGLAVVRAGQRQYADAAGTIQLAAQSDSAVVDSLIAGAAAGWFESAGDRGGALTWARMAVQKSPGDAGSWLRIAMTLRARQDTTPEGEAAVRRYMTLSGDRAEKVAHALLAENLYNHGKTDSALALVTFAAQDTAYREYAAQLYLQAGRDAFQHRDVEKAIALLAQGRAFAVPAQLPAFSNITGRAMLLKLQSLLADAEETHSCDHAHAADSLATLTERNLREGVPFDSARTTMMLASVLPGFKQNAQTAIMSCRAPGAPARRPATRPATRPAARPAPARRP